MINVCLACDDNYAKYAGVVIASVLANANKNDELCFYILDGGIKNKNKEKISQLKSIKDCEINFVPIDNSLFTDYMDVKTHAYISIPTFYRLKLPSLLPNVKRVIYFDCDFVVTSSLARLFNKNMGDYPVAGVLDINKKALKLNPNYVNSGMLLFNCNYCRKEHFFDKVVDFAKNNAKIIEFCDQDSINKVVDEYKLVISPKYNLMDTWWRGGYYEFEGEEEAEYLQAKENPVIVHLTGLKPAFKGCGNKFKDEWWEVAKKTKIYDELLRDYMTSKEPSDKEPLLRQVFSIKNEYKGKTKTKVLRLLGLKIKLK